MAATTIITSFLKDVLRKHIFGIEAMPMPIDMKIALYINPDGIEENEPTGELVDANYQRMPLTFDENNIQEAFHFVGMTTDVTISHYSVIGNINGTDKILFAKGDVDAPLTYARGEPIWFAGGDIDMDVLPVDV